MEFVYGLNGMRVFFKFEQRLLGHTGFSVRSRVRAKIKPEAERVGKYMIRPLLALERLSIVEPESKV
jgi:hypothetical protein